MTPFEDAYGWLNMMRQNGATWKELWPKMEAFYATFRNAQFDRNAEWLMLNGLMVKRGEKRVIYPDPTSYDLVESHFGCLNMMRQLGMEEERERAHREFCERLHHPLKLQVEPMPKDFSAEDEFRARGLGIRLTDTSPDQP